MLKLFKPLLKRTNRVLISTASKGEEEVRAFVEQAKLDCENRVFGVANTYHDWSGFLALLAEASDQRIIMGNDSIITRRLIRKSDIVQLADLLEACKRPSLIGELDNARVSVVVDAYSSSAWVSSYLFGLNFGDSMSARCFANSLSAGCQSIPDQTRETFLKFLYLRRQDILSTIPDGGGKLHAMYLERLMTHFAAANEFDIVNQYGGNWNRKLRRFIESKLL